MGWSTLVPWTVLVAVVSRTVFCGPYPRSFGTFYNSNGYFHFADKTHQQQYNYYQTVTIRSPETTKNAKIIETPKLVSTNEIDPDSSGPEAVSFSYRDEDAFGPSNWGALNSNCNGLYQSPIDLVTNRTLVVRQKRPLRLEGLSMRPWQMDVENEGGSAAFFPEYRASERPRLSGGPLKTDYLFQQFHYHLGSEHTFEGKRYAAEAHFVFFNSLYETFEEARGQVDGIAVIAVVYEVLKSDRIKSLNNWTRFLTKVVKDGSVYEVSPYGLFPLGDVLGSVQWPYYAYEGSFTTPPCAETVQWIVASERVPLTKSELVRMRNLKGRGGRWVQNARPTQARNYRRVFIY
ncbi:hypothetical protein pipiens_008295 [Culex pipiens pipiens]|uniref:Alpha-carbonic anhydrase domain-containing protein n=2 Tax=Culex pipiens pipiens TaxID=38569 RepID=A0ABD1DIF6_CULPP